MTKKEMGPRHFLYPQPAALIGANVNGKPNYLVAAWCGVMQATPALVYVAIRKVRYTLKGIEENGTYSINVPSADMVVETDYCGTVSGRDTDKSKVFTTFYGKLGTAPMVEECPTNMECRVKDILDFGGTHKIIIGEIAESYVNEDILDGDEPDVKKIDPIIYSTGGGYWRFGERIGDAFSMGGRYKAKQQEE